MDEQWAREAREASEARIEYRRDSEGRTRAEKSEVSGSSYPLKKLLRAAVTAVSSLRRPVMTRRETNDQSVSSAGGRTPSGPPLRPEGEIGERISSRLPKIFAISPAKTDNETLRAARERASPSDRPSRHLRIRLPDPRHRPLGDYAGFPYSWESSARPALEGLREGLPAGGQPGRKLR